MIKPLERDDYVKAIDGPFKNKTGWVSRANEDSACVVFKGVWEHGIWYSINDLKRTTHKKSKQFDKGSKYE